MGERRVGCREGRGRDRNKRRRGPVAHHRHDTQKVRM